MKRSCLAILVAVTLLLTSGCTSEIDAQVSRYNEDTEATISMYASVVNEMQDRDEELILGIAAGDLSAFPIADDLDIKSVTEELEANTNPLIEQAPFISSSNFYTRLGRKSVVHVLCFLYRGTNYLMEVIWSEGKLAAINLEVVANG